MGACSSQPGLHHTPNTGELNVTVTERWTGAVVLSADQKPVHLQPPPHGGSQKMRVGQARRVIIVGDHRVKVATARYVRSVSKDIEVYVGLTDPSKGEALRNEGLQLLSVSLGKSSLYNAIKKLDHIDCAFVVSPATSSKIQETCQAVNSFKRAGVSHVVILSNTVVERDSSAAGSSQEPNIFGDQCRSIETYLIKSGLSYTIVRVPIFMDNYISQLESICSNGLFYRPVHPKTRRNSICISDLAEAVGKILISPLQYSDCVVSLNGALTSCEQAAGAFARALGRPVVYEQTSPAAYKSMMLNACVPEWQAEGLLQMFKCYDDQEPFCLQPSTELTKILGRPPTDVFQFADHVIAAVRTKLKGDRNSRLTLPDPQDGDSTWMPVGIDAPAAEPGQVYLDIDHSRSIKPTFDLSSVQSTLPPQGVRGVLNVAIGIKQHFGQKSRSGSMDDGSTLSSAAATVTKDRSASTGSRDSLEGSLHGTMKTTNYGSKCVVLLDGVLSFMPVQSSSVPGAPELLALSHNKAVSLAGFVLQREAGARLKLASSRGEDVVYILDCHGEEETALWEEHLLEHVDHCDKSRSIWMF